MTPARLRQIASRIEQVCVDFRKLTVRQCTPCSTCLAAAEELREFAKTMPIPNNKADGLDRAGAAKAVAIGECGG